jgi:radical SAM superfamily enzyme YgiQ (UPF0313 family)
MDTEQFRAPPTTNGALLAHFRTYGGNSAHTEIELVHFLEAADLDGWLDHDWPERIRPALERAVADGTEVVFGFSCYTWNVAEFLDLARLVRRAVPEARIIAGGPHVQRPEDFLFDEAIDLIVLGEGEETFTELMDRPSSEWSSVVGCATVSGDEVIRTQPRARSRDLDTFPSALDFVPLRDEQGEPLYASASYESTRGCPYKCAFCEWGTGAVGTKMYQFSLDRIRSDLEKLVAGGIRDIWLADSNFGALREDEAKTEIVVDLRRKTGLPNTLATSWSKYHNDRVQRIVRSLHSEGLLSHYHLALQTLTPEALDLSNRKNMKANDYEPIVKAMAEEGVPVAAELIWGLPGDDLGEFEKNLDHLLSVFPNINIFGYTLLPGTEFYELRDRYRLETVPVAGYGKAKGEYVVGCHSFTRDEGEEGYFLSTAYIVLARGQLIPLASRYLALTERVPVAAMLRQILRALLVEYGIDDSDRMDVYERRSEIYVELLSDPERAFTTIRREMAAWLRRHDGGDLVDVIDRLLDLDRALCPIVGASRSVYSQLKFPAQEVERALAAMEKPGDELLAGGGCYTIGIAHPGGLGEICKDPDGGEWIRGRIVHADNGRPESAATAEHSPERVAG